MSTYDGPMLVIAADPDSEHTALAWAMWLTSSEWWEIVGTFGGGSGKPVAYSTITGATAWLCEAYKNSGIPFARMVFVCETQAPNGPQSASVEALRRVRYHWEAACELLGVQYVEVSPSTWELHFGGGEVRGTGQGSLKKACQDKAKAIAGKRLRNEDQRDAFGILSWYVETQLSKRLIVGG